ncbi:MAG TPA: hypothetical protein VK272_13505 [Solirubrobacteraceae bacterium]|nr:hypothetical protein [Solirubrobacteraceae bacterium]
MATQAQPSAREQLARLLDEQSRRTAEWLERLPAVRAKSAAMGVVLDRLANTWPTDPPPRHPYADVVLATPDKLWAEDVATRLRNALPPGARIDLGTFVPSAGDGEWMTTFTVRCPVSLPGVSGAKTTERVCAALAAMDDLVVDYTEVLSLVVVYPRL